MTWTGVRTIMVLELRQRVRATRWRIMLGIWLAVLILLCGGLVITVKVQMPNSSNTEYLLSLYDLVVCFVLGIGLIVAPTLSATSINGDRADATLALLQATALRSREIVVGKLLAAWVAAIAFLGVAVPFLIGLTVAGGSHWQALLAHLVILVFTLGAVCALGLGGPDLPRGGRPRRRDSTVHGHQLTPGGRQPDTGDLQPGLRQIHQRHARVQDRPRGLGRGGHPHRSDLVDAGPQPLRGPGGRHRPRAPSAQRLGPPQQLLPAGGHGFVD